MFRSLFGKRPEAPQVEAAPKPQAKRPEAKRPRAEQKADEADYLEGDVVDVAEVGATRERGVSPERQRFERAEKLVGIYGQVNVLLNISNQVTNITLPGERPPVAAARERVRTARANVLAQLGFAAAMLFGAHHVAKETVQGNTSIVAEGINGGPLTGYAREAMQDFEGASEAYLRFEDDVRTGLDRVMEHARRDVEAVRREEQLQAAEEGRGAVSAQQVTTRTTDAHPAVTSHHASGRGVGHHGSSRGHHGRNGRTASR